MKDGKITNAVNALWQLSQRTELKVQDIEKVREGDSLDAEIEAADTLEQLVEDNRAMLLEAERSLRSFREASPTHR